MTDRQKEIMAAKLLVVDLRYANERITSRQIVDTVRERLGIEISFSSASRWCRKAGVPLMNPMTQAKTAARLRALELRKDRPELSGPEIRTQLIEEGFDVAAATVAKWCQVAGIPLPGNKGSRRTTPRDDEAPTPLWQVLDDEVEKRGVPWDKALLRVMRLWTGSNKVAA